MNTTSTIPLISLAFLAVALTVATSCGTNSESRIGSNPTTTAPATTSTASASTTSVVPTTNVAATTRPTATIDQLVGAEGERVHVRCIGEGDTTVLLVAGFEGDSTGWGAVESAVSRQARTCSYDRPGTGTSDPAISTATFITQADELRTLLKTVGEPGPYVVVGHSFGGAQAVTFASLFADEVVGLVLVDASPTTWPAALCAVPDDHSDGAAFLRGLCNGNFQPNGNSELLDVAAAFAEAAQIDSLGPMPTAVITATRRELPADLADTEVDRLNGAWLQGQHDWVALSTTALLVTVEDTGHHIEIDQPAVVIDEITRLLP